jgi:hypothetical protein
MSSKIKPFPMGRKQENPRKNSDFRRSPHKDDDKFLEEDSLCYLFKQTDFPLHFLWNCDAIATLIHHLVRPPILCRLISANRQSGFSIKFGLTFAVVAPFAADFSPTLWRQ